MLIASRRSPLALCLLVSALIIGSTALSGEPALAQVPTPTAKPSQWADWPFDVKPTVTRPKAGGPEIVSLVVPTDHPQAAAIRAEFLKRVGAQQTSSAPSTTLLGATPSATSALASELCAPSPDDLLLPLAHNWNGPVGDTAGDTAGQVYYNYYGTTYTNCAFGRSGYAYANVVSGQGYAVWFVVTSIGTTETFYDVVHVCQAASCTYYTSVNQGFSPGYAPARADLYWTGYSYWTLSGCGLRT